MGRVLDYFRSVGRNKWTLTGYLAGGIGAATTAFSLDPEAGEGVRELAGMASAHLLMYSSAALVLTRAGLDTLKALRKARKDIEENGAVQVQRDIDRGSYGRWYRGRPYCTRVGIDLALSETDLDTRPLESYRPKSPF